MGDLKNNLPRKEAVERWVRAANKITDPIDRSKSKARNEEVALQSRERMKAGFNGGKEM